MGARDGARLGPADVRRFLEIQEREARWWRDASLAYFQSLARQPWPAGATPPARTLACYRRVRCPADPPKPRCDAVP